MRATTLTALKRLTVSYKDLLEGLADCRRLIKKKVLVERVISAAGYKAGNFLWNERLEVYCDVSDDDRDVGYISKGWEDQGYRLGTCLTMPLEFAGPLNLRLKELCQTWATEGFMVSVMEDEGELTVKLECLICEAGLTRVSVRNWFRRLARCGTLVQDSMDASVVDTLTA